MFQKGLVTLHEWDITEVCMSKVSAVEDQAALDCKK